MSNSELSPRQLDELEDSQEEYLNASKEMHGNWGGSCAQASVNSRFHLATEALRYSLKKARDWQDALAPGVIPPTRMVYAQWSAKYDQVQLLPFAEGNNNTNNNHLGSAVQILQQQVVCIPISRLSSRCQ